MGAQPEQEPDNAAAVAVCSDKAMIRASGAQGAELKTTQESTPIGRQYVMKGRVLFLLRGAPFCGSTVAAGEPPLYVGVLEDGQNFPGNHQFPILSAEPHVRIAFRKQGAEWLPMDTNYPNLAALHVANSTYPSAVDWTVVFDGKAIGRISSRNPGSLHWFADLGVQIITSDLANVPKISAGARDFVYTTGAASSKPLLLVSQPSFLDPQHWKPTALSTAEKNLAIQALRKVVPRMPQCQQPETLGTMVPYADSEIIFIKAYRSISNEVFFGERLDGKRSICGWFNDEHFFDYWFVLTPGQGLRPLGHGLMPMEAADLDNSGKSEWILHSLRGEDSEGYEIYYDDFSKLASFHWSEH
jgi:hypothetical protein